MQELGNAVGRFVGGLSGPDELRKAFHDFLRRQPEQREAVSRWLNERIRSGRIAPAVLQAVGDLIASPAAAQPAASAATRLESRMRAGAARDPDGAGLPPAPAPPPSLDDGALREGSVLDGRYTIVAELGRGGMGTVFKARDRNREDFQDRHPYIALKVLSEEFKRHPDARIALQRETVRVQNLAHPNVVTVYDFDYDGPHAYMTMELLEGEPLAEWLQSPASKEAASPRRWLMIRGIGAGLAYAHEKGVVHSDLKPGNIFVCRTGAVKVMDFGIARPLRAVTEHGTTTLFDPGERLGGLTPAYASLEQWNREPPDPRDDIYAFACVVYAIYGGRHPFGGASAKSAAESNLSAPRLESLTRRQWDALRRGLAFKRVDRIGSIDEFLRQFAPRTWLQRHRAWLLSAAAVLAAVALTIGALSYRDYVKNETAFVEDEALNAQLWPRPEANAKPLTPEQQRDIEDFLYLATDALHQAETTKSVADLSAILAKGDNNVLALLRRVRALDTTNAQAVKLASNAAQLYAVRARSELSANRLTDALRLVAEGQNFQHTRDLLRIRREVCARSSAACASSED